MRVAPPANCLDPGNNRRELCDTQHILLDSTPAGTYHRFNRFCLNALGVPVPQAIALSRMHEDEMLSSVAFPAAFDVVAIIIDGIILLAGET